MQTHIEMDICLFVCLFVCAYVLCVERRRIRQIVATNGGTHAT